MKNSIEISRASHVAGAISISASKSLSNRAIHVAALARGTSFIKNLSTSLDTAQMISLWKKLGVSIEFDEAKKNILVRGRGGFIPSYSKTLDVGDAGTAARFLFGVLPWGKGTYHVKASPGMDKRPQDELLKALESLGSRVLFHQKEYRTPFSFMPGVLSDKSSLEVSGDKSSQYISSLLMALPLCQKEFSLEYSQDFVSKPYVDMTIKMMRYFGVEIQEKEKSFLLPAVTSYTAAEYEVEADMSSASYFVALAAIHGASLKLCGVKNESWQGDRAIFDIAEKMGCVVTWLRDGVSVKGPAKLVGIDLDMNHVPDLVPAVVAMAVWAEGASCLKNISHLQHKESKRLSTLCCEFSKLGMDLFFDKDSLNIRGNYKENKAAYKTVDSHNDHRIAMSLAVAATRRGAVLLVNDQCVAKSFPEFFENLLLCTSS